MGIPNFLRNVIMIHDSLKLVTLQICPHYFAVDSILQYLEGPFSKFIKKI